MLIKQIFCRHARQCISINVVKNGKPIFSDWYQPLKALIRNAANTHSANRTMSTIPPQLVVRPNGQLLIDDNLEIKITGLAKHQKTTLHAVTREGSSVFESCCCYTSDENGEVNLATHPSLSGSYTGLYSFLALVIF